MKQPADNVAQVRVYADGRLTLNGSAVSLDEIREAFASLAARKGEVWYYREQGNAEPHPNAMAVMAALADARLPISMSSRPDFGNVVLPDGSTQPRP